MVEQERLTLATEFLSYLIGTSTTDHNFYYHLWRLDTKTSFWHTPAKLEMAAQKVAVAQGDVYVGVGVSGQQYQANERLREETTIGRFGFVADLDCKPEAFSSKEQALEFANRLLVKPSIIVDSGGGLQCWWVFDRIWFFENDEEKSRAVSYAQGWHEFLSKKAQKLGVVLDSVWDLARIMRIPGGYNHKRQPLQLVKPLQYGERVEAEIFDDFASRVVSFPSPTVTPQALKTSTSSELDDLDEFCKGQVGTAWIPELTAREYELFELACPKWDGTYKMTRRDPRMRDKSKSEFAFSLAGQAAWPKLFHFSTVLTALVNFYRKHGMGDKEKRLDWFVATVRKAAVTNPGDERSVISLASESEMLEVVAPEAPAKDKVTAIARLLEIPVRKFLKWGIEPVTFGVEIANRQIEIGSPSDVLLQARWRSVLYGFGYLMKPQSKQQWETILKELRNLWELQPTGAVADRQLNLKHLVADLIVSSGMVVEDRQDRIRAHKRGLPYVHHSRDGTTTWNVPVRIVRRLIEERDGKSPTNVDMNRDMSKIGYFYTRKNVSTGGKDKTGYYIGGPLPAPDHDPRILGIAFAGNEDDEDEDAN